MNYHSPRLDRCVTPERPPYVCWTRMQAEAGQELTTIVLRKELERRAGGGLFFWGVGNAPSKLAQPLARVGVPVPVIFSVMKSAPKKADMRPSGILAWNGYLDCHGVEQEVPGHVLVTSRSETGGGPKKTHFALMCCSLEPLKLREGVSFNHRNYRNAGSVGGAVGASQVTALLEPCTPGVSSAPEYQQSMSAVLTGSYWVRLTRPVRLPPEVTVGTLTDVEDYRQLVAYCRRSSTEPANHAGLLL